MAPRNLSGLSINPAVREAFDVLVASLGLDGKERAQDQFSPEDPLGEIRLLSTVIQYNSRSRPRSPATTLAWLKHSIRNTSLTVTGIGLPQPAEPGSKSRKRS